MFFRKCLHQVFHIFPEPYLLYLQRFQKISAESWNNTMEWKKEKGWLWRREPFPKYNSMPRVNHTCSPWLALPFGAHWYFNLTLKSWVLQAWFPSELFYMSRCRNQSESSHLDRAFTVQKSASYWQSTLWLSYVTNSPSPPEII